MEDDEKPNKVRSAMLRQLEMTQTAPGSMSHWAKLVIVQVTRRGDAFENKAHLLFVFPGLDPVCVLAKKEVIMPPPFGKASIRVAARRDKTNSAKCKPQWHLSLPKALSGTGKVLNEPGSPKRIFELVQERFAAE